MIMQKRLAGLEDSRNGVCCSRCKEIVNKLLYVFELQENEYAKKVYCRCGCCGQIVIVREYDDEHCDIDGKVMEVLDDKTEE